MPVLVSHFPENPPLLEDKVNDIRGPRIAASVGSTNESLWMSSPSESKPTAQRLFPSYFALFIVEVGEGWGYWNSVWIESI